MWITTICVTQLVHVVINVMSTFLVNSLLIKVGVHDKEMHYQISLLFIFSSDYIFWSYPLGKLYRQQKSIGYLTENF
jgi:hypothetical protein